MDVLSFIRPKSKALAETEYEKGRVYAFESMINIYMLFRKNYDQTRQSIYFFTYITKMIDMCGQRKDDFSKGQVNAYEETFNYFKPSRRKDLKCMIQD